MKVRVLVSMKSSVLDPQGQAIRSALAGRGYKQVTGVRQGKVFEIEIAPGADAAQARRDIEEIAREILANPVIEDYRIEWE